MARGVGPGHVAEVSGLYSVDFLYPEAPRYPSRKMASDHDRSLLLANRGDLAKMKRLCGAGFRRCVRYGVRRGVRAGAPGAENPENQQSETRPTPVQRHCTHERDHLLALSPHPERRCLADGAKLITFVSDFR
jgi:hypothetical protein